MLKNLIWFAALFLLSSYAASSQKVMHSLGANISMMFSKLATRGSTSTFVLSHTDFSYFPRYVVTSGDKTSLSIGMPLGAGIGLIRDDYSGGGVYFGFDAPLVADYNFGCRSSRENEDRFGGYVGGGFGYTYTNYNVGYGSNNANSYGPLVRAGLRFMLGGERDEEMSIGVFYKKGLETEKFNTVGFNILTDF